MAKYYNITSEIFITDTLITVTSFFGGNVLSTSITRGGSEDTALAAAIVAHKNAFISLAPTSTSPPCYVTERGKWIKLTPSGTVTTDNAVVKVPTGNSGILILHVDPSAYTAQRSVNGGTFTTFTDGATVTLTDGQTLKFKGLGLVEQDFLNGSVVDSDTGQTLDDFSLMNSSPTP